MSNTYHHKKKFKEKFSWSKQEKKFEKSLRKRNKQELLENINKKNMRNDIYTEYPLCKFNLEDMIKDKEGNVFTVVEIDKNKVDLLTQSGVRYQAELSYVNDCFTKIN